MPAGGAFNGEVRVFLPPVQTAEIQLYSSEYEISVKNNVAPIEKSLLFFTESCGGRDNHEHRMKCSRKQTKKQQ